MTLSIGQKLWYVPTSYRRQEPYEVEVTKTGRKWATVTNGWREFRIDIDTLWADGGRCYIDREAYEKETALIKSWDDFRGLVSRLYSLPTGVTLEKIKQAKLSLGLTP